MQNWLLQLSPQILLSVISVINVLLERKTYKKFSDPAVNSSHLEREGFLALPTLRPYVKEICTEEKNQDIKLESCQVSGRANLWLSYRS